MSTPHEAVICPACMGNRMLDGEHGTGPCPICAATGHLLPTQAKGVTFSYLNHRGELTDRQVIPAGFWYDWEGEHPFYKQPGVFYLKGWDLQKGAWRDFQFSRMQPARVTPEGSPLHVSPPSSDGQAVQGRPGSADGRAVGQAGRLSHVAYGQQNRG